MSYHLPITTHHPPFTPQNLPFTVYLCHFSRKTNPISKNAQMNLTSVFTMGYKNMGPSTDRKANPSKPKQSQSDPRFSPVMAPQTQNKPKQTQSPQKPQESTQPLFPQRVTGKRTPFTLLARPPASPQRQKPDCGPPPATAGQRIYREGAMTMVYSPFGFSSTSASSCERVPRLTDSNIFVSSLARAAWRSPKTSSASFRKLRRRYGLS